MSGLNLGVGRGDRGGAKESADGERARLHHDSSDRDRHRSDGQGGAEAEAGGSQRVGGASDKCECDAEENERLEPAANDDERLYQRSCPGGRSLLGQRSPPMWAKA